MFLPFKIRWRFNVHTDLLWKRKIINTEMNQLQINLKFHTEKKSTSYKFMTLKNELRICQESRYPELSFQTCPWHALNLLSTFIFLWFWHRDYELCLTEVLKSSHGKHKKWTILAVLHGNCNITHRNAKLWTVFEYIIEMSECLVFWVVLTCCTHI